MKETERYGTKHRRGGPESDFTYVGHACVRETRPAPPNRVRTRTFRFFFFLDPTLHERGQRKGTVRGPNTRLLFTNHPPNQLFIMHHEILIFNERKGTKKRLRNLCKIAREKKAINDKGRRRGRRRRVGGKAQARKRQLVSRHKKEIYEKERGEKGGRRRKCGVEAYLLVLIVTRHLWVML